MRDMGGGISNIRKLVLGEHPVSLNPFDVIEAQVISPSSLSLRHYNILDAFVTIESS